MSPVGQTELLRLLGSTRPEDRSALLRFAREAPLAYGWWRDWKWLYKQAEARPAAELLGALLGRLDAAPFPAFGPAALKANPAKVENVVSLATSETYAYVLLGGHNERRNVRVLDLSDPSAPVELAGTHVGGASRLLLQGPRLLVFSGGGWRESEKVHSFDVSQPGLLLSTGRFDVPQGSITQSAGSRLYSLSQNGYSADRPGLSILDVTATGTLEKRGFVGIENPTALALSGDRAVVLSRNGYHGPISLKVVDVSDPAKPRLGSTVDVPDATGVAFQGNDIYVTLGEPPAYYTQNATGRVRGLRVFHLSSGLLSAVGLQAGLREVAALELGNARSVQIAGRYAYVCLSHSGSHRTKNLRPGGLRIVDIGDSQRPQLVGSLDGIDAQSVTIVGSRAYVSAGPDTGFSYYGATATPRTLHLVDIADPAKPLLIGASPSRDTLGYMKRRARRTLCSLAKTDPETFVRLAYETLAQSGRGRDALDLTAQWVSADLLYGGTDRCAQGSHGRGRYRQMRQGTSRRTRDERFPATWDRHPDLAAALLAAPNLPWQTQEMALKALQSNGVTPPSVPTPVLARLLNSPSPLLISFAARQTMLRLGDGGQTEPAVAADAFFFGNVSLRRQIKDGLDRRARPDWWAPQFARRVFERATTDLQAGRLSRRQVGAVAFVASEFPEALPAELLRPVFGLLLAAGRPALTEWVLGTVGRAAPAEALGWLAALADSTDDVREQGTAALRAGLREQAFDYAAAWALVQAESGWVREQGWTLLAQSRTEAGTLARVWGELLDSPQMTPALETAFASPAALALLRRTPLDGQTLMSRLESRPFLARLLSGPAFSLVAQTLPPAVLLQLIKAMPDDQWQSVRTSFVEALGAEGRLEDFWRAAWDMLGGGADAHLGARLLGDPGFAGSFLSVDDPTFLETTTNPVFNDLLGLWAQAHTERFVRDSSLLLAAAAHQLPAVREWGLRRVRAVGLGLPFALRLLESELPSSAVVGQTYFEAAPVGSPAEFEGALALCDSPKASVRVWGRGYVDRRWQGLPTSDLLGRLAESGDPHTQAFLAAKLRGLPPDGAPDGPSVQEFDRQVLRARDQGRRAKELVKARRDRPGSPTEDTLDTATLLETARSLTPRDSEWALGQLARRALAGQEIDGLTLDGLAGV